MLTFDHSDSSPRAGRRGYLPRWVAVLVAFAMSLVGLSAVAPPALAAAATYAVGNTPTYIAGSQSIVPVGSTYTPTYIGSYTAPVTLTSTTTNVCTASAGVVSFIAPGTCTVSLVDSATPPVGAGSFSLTVGTVQVTDRPDGTVNAIAQDANANTYLGGAFSSVRTETGSGGGLGKYVSFAPYGGAVDHSMPAVSGGDVRSSVSDGSGGWYIGGAFTSVGGLTRNGLAHILASGSVDVWNPNANGAVYALAINGATLYVGGSFTMFGGVNGTTRNRLAAFDLSASPLSNTPTSWNPDVNDEVYALGVSTSPSTIVIAGGKFTSVGGANATTRNHAAAWATDGHLNSAFNPDLDGDVYVVNAGNTSVVYLGGGFTNVYASDSSASTQRAYVLKWDTNNAIPLQIYNAKVDGAVRAIATFSTSVFLGGDFTKAGSSVPQATYGHLLRTASATGLPTASSGTSGWGANVLDTVYALTFVGSYVYVGGSFTSAGGQSRGRLAAFSSNSNTYGPTGWSPPANDTVYTLAASSTGNQVFAGGAFSTLGSASRNNLASLDSKGIVTSFNPNADAAVKALAVSGSTVYAGGAFTTMASTARNGLAAVGTDKGTLSSWNPNANGVVNSMAVSGNTLYVGGDFTTLGGTTARNRLAAFDTSAVTDTPTSWDPNADAAVNALAVSGSTLYAGGAFTSMGSTTRNRLAAIGTADGSPTSWDPNADAAVNALAVSGSTVYAGGAFSSIGSTTRNSLAAIDTDGTLSSWNPNAGAAVNVVAVSGSTVYAGGAFTTMGSTTRNRLAAIGTDGTLSSWDQNADNAVNALLVSGSSVYAGGAFTSVASTPRSRYLAKLKSPIAITAASPSSVDSVTAVPSVGYTTSPSTVAGDWSVEPSCAVYTSADTTFATALTGAQAAGTYVTHCSGGTSASYSPASYVDGSLTVTQYVPPKTSVVVTASSPASVDSSTALPSISYTTSPSTVAGDWSVEPTCAVYASSDTGYATALTGAQPVGTYVTHCSGGSSGSYNPTSYVDGSLTVTSASTDVAVTAATSSITYGASIPSVGYSTAPSTVAGDWTSEPSCAVYSTTDTTYASPLSGQHSAGTYVTHCAGGSSSSYTPTSYVDGVFTIDKAASSTVITCPTASETFDGGVHTPCSADVTGAGLATTASVIYTNNTNAGIATADASYDGDSNHTSSTAVQSGFTIDQAPSTTTVSCPASSVTFNGSEQTPCTASVSGAGLSQSVDVVYSPNTDAGLVSASASFIGDANHYGSADQSGFTIDQAVSTTTVFCSLSSVTYNGSAQTPCSAQVTGAGGLSQSVDVVYSPNTDAGSVSVSASFIGDANHYGSSDASGFTIDQASSSTTVTCSPKSTTYSGIAQALCSASVSGAGGLALTGLTPSYTANTNVGTVTASYTYSGDSNHTGSNGSDTFAIDPSAVVVTASSPTITYGASIPFITYTTSPVTTASDWTTEPVCAVYATADTTFATPLSGVVGAGSYVTHCSNGSSSNYTTSSSVPGTLTVDKADTTTVVTCSPTSGVYDGSAQTPCTASVTGAGGLASTVSVNYAGNTNVGTATADASFAGDANHNGSTATQQSFTITQAASATTITCAPSYVYSGSAIENCTAAVTGAGGLSTSVTPTYSTDHTNVGNVTVNASYAGDANHDGSSATQASFTIGKASSTTTISCPSSVPFTGVAQTPCSAAVTGAGGLTTTATVIYANNTSVGSATANATYAGDANHDGSSATQVAFSIGKTSVVVSAPIVSIAYGASIPAVGFSSNPVTTVGDWTTTPTCAVYAPLGITALTGVQPVGTYETRCSGGVSSNYAVSSYVKGSLTITAATSTTTITCVAASYTGSAVTPCTATVTGAGLTAITATPTYSNNINAGSNTATASYTWPGDANHTGSTGSLNFTIGQSLPTVTITCSPTSVVYTGVAQTPCGTTATVTAAGGLSTTTPVTYSNNIDVAAATATTAPTATASYAGGGNYLAVSVFKTFAITKAASVTVAVASPTVAYSATLPTITATAPAGGFTTNPTCGVYANAAATTALTGAQNVGTYVTKCSGGVARNFTAITYTSGTLTITKAATVSVTASTPTAITYGAALPTVTSTTPGGGWTTAPTCGVYASATATAALTGVQNAGTTYVTKCSGGVALNYTAVTYVNGKLTINKAATTSVTASSGSITYGSALPTITATTPTGGWTTAPTCGVYANATSTTRLTGTQAVGSYVTKCSGGVAVNYTTVTYVNGMFTITKGNVFVTAQSTTGTRNGNIPTPTYTTNPTGVTFTTAPTCRVYSSTDTTYATPLTGKFPAVSAVYVTRCTGAVSANYTPSYVNGTITVA